jgi:phage terminase Nu1 subunit (DNA packaging protein)
MAEEDYGNETSKRMLGRLERFDLTYTVSIMCEPVNDVKDGKVLSQIS